MSRQNIVRPVFSVMIVIACGLLIAIPDTATAQDKATVSLELQMNERAGGCKISVDPADAVLSRDGAGVVNWVSAEPGYFWEIRYAADLKTEGSTAENYFGTVDIECTKASREKTAEFKPAVETDNAEWPYMIAVYSCNGREKGELLCDVDPRIKWVASTVAN